MRRLQSRGGRNRTARRARVVASLVALAVVTAGCAAQDDQSLCVSYEEYVSAADEVRSADPTGATAGDAADAADVLLGELDQLRAVADSRYRAPIDDLERVLRDVRLTLVSLQSDDDYGTWEPLVEESLEDAGIADDRLRRQIEPACNPDLD